MHEQKLIKIAKSQEKLKEHEERKAAQEKVRTLSRRLTFLLNKLQADEEAKVVQREEIKKLEALEDAKYQSPRSNINLRDAIFGVGTQVDTAAISRPESRQSQ